MAELKTKVNDGSVELFLNGIENSRKRQDSYKILDLMKEVTGEEPRMWGESIGGLYGRSERVEAAALREITAGRGKKKNYG